jgi:hypothetical protein
MPKGLGDPSPLLFSKGAHLRWGDQRRVEVDAKMRVLAPFDMSVSYTGAAFEELRKFVNAAVAGVTIGWE